MTRWMVRLPAKIVVWIAGLGFVKLLQESWSVEGANSNTPTAIGHMRLIFSMGQVFHWSGS